MKFNVGKLCIDFLLVSVVFFLEARKRNYGTEYWNGDIAELILFARALSDTEREAVWTYLSNRYQLKFGAQPNDPQHLALASLCHVLMNTNEFLYID